MGTTKAQRTHTLAAGTWIAILIITGSFQVYRDAIPDGLVFYTMAALLLVSQTNVLSRFDRWRLRPRRVLVALTIVFAAAALVLTPRHGIVDELVVVASGILVVVIAWPDPPSGSKTEREPWNVRTKRAATAWSILGILLCLWELAMYFAGHGQSARTEFLALSELVDPILNDRIGRVVGVAAWLAGGFALVRTSTKRASGDNL